MLLLPCQQVCLPFFTASTAVPWARQPQRDCSPCTFPVSGPVLPWRCPVGSAGLQGRVPWLGFVATGLLHCGCATSVVGGESRSRSILRAGHALRASRCSNPARPQGRKPDTVTAALTHQGEWCRASCLFTYLFWMCQRMSNLKAHHCNLSNCNHYSQFTLNSFPAWSFSFFFLIPISWRVEREEQNFGMNFKWNLILSTFLETWMGWYFQFCFGWVLGGVLFVCLLALNTHLVFYFKR